MKQFTKSKRAQQEAFGLIFIVLVVFIAIFIFVKLQADSGGENLREAYELTEMSSGSLNVFMEVSVPECAGKTFSEILIDCLKDENSRCNSNYNECELFATHSKVLFDNLFSEDKINMFYEFIIESEEVEIPVVLREVNSVSEESQKLIINNFEEDLGCDEKIKGSNYFIPLTFADVPMTLRICYRT